MSRSEDRFVVDVGDVDPVDLHEHERQTSEPFGEPIPSVAELAELERAAERPGRERPW